MKRTILFFAMLLWSIPVNAAEKWTRVQSKNFTLAGNATENEIRATAEDLEVFRTAFSRFFKMKDGSSVATTVIVFPRELARIEAERNTIPPGTVRIRGVVTLLDCKNALTISVVVDGKTLKLHTDKPNELKFTSGNPLIGGEIACGPLPGKGVPAVVIYRPQSPPQSETEGNGEPISVEFVRED